MTKVNVSDDVLAKIVEESFSMFEVLRKIGLSPLSGGSHSTYSSRVRSLGISTSHFTRGKLKPENLSPIKEPVADRCKFCDRQILNRGSLAAHSKCCKQNPNRVVPVRSPNAGARLGSTAWNKGLRGDPRCKPSEETLRKLRASPRVYDSESPLEIERRRKISEYAKKHNGGKRHGSGRGKKGWYNGIFCDSSWELAFLMYHADHGIEVFRCDEVRMYEWEGRTRKYLPDFVVEGTIYEIKGYISPQSLAKKFAHPDIVVLGNLEMTPYLEYCVAKYGKNYISKYTTE